MVALKARTGELVWERTVDRLDEIKQWYGGTIPGTTPKAVPGQPPPRGVKIGVDFEPVDLLVRDGDKVAMSRWRFAPAETDGKPSAGAVEVPITFKLVD